MFGISVWISAFLFTSAFVAILMSIYTQNKKQVPVARPFTYFCVCTAIYSFGYAMEILSDNINSMLSWNLFQLIGVELIPAFWIIIALEYSGEEKRLSPLKKVIIFLIPTLFLIIRFTNPLHHLFYKSMELKTNGYFGVMHLDKGILYYVNGIYITGVVLLSNILFLKKLLRSKGVIRYQAMVMFIASLFPYAAYCLLIANASPLDLDFTPMAIIFSNILFLIVLFKYKFLNLVPLARDKVFDSIKDAVLVLDNNFNIEDYNISAAKIFTKLNKEAIGKDINILSDEYDDFTRSVFEGNETQFEVKRDNCSYHYSTKMSMLYSKRDDIIGYILILNDITDEVESIKRLKQLASIDGLTGIYNRRYFIENCEIELEDAKKEGQQLSLILFDIDSFKGINDQFGHLAGDMVLKKVVEICSENIRSKDIFGRFGGEEFIIFLPQTTLQEAEAIGENLRESIEMLDLMFESRKIRVTSSFGITGVIGEYIQSEMDLDTLIKFADKALYLAKTSGKNCVKILSMREPKVD